MRVINRVSTLVAIVVVLAYLIARPHIGTVWYLTQDAPVPVPSWLKTDTPPPGFGPGVPPPPLPRTRFIDKRDCFNAESRYENASGTSGVYCATENALLWGW